MSDVERKPIQWKTNPEGLPKKLVGRLPTKQKGRKMPLENETNPIEVSPENIPNWIWTSKAKNPEGALITFMIASGMGRGVLESFIAKNKQEHGIRIKGSPEKVVLKWKIPPGENQMKSAQGKEWAIKHKRRWMANNPIFKNEWSFKNGYPSRIQCDPAVNSPLEIESWETFMDYATQVNYVPQAIQTAIERKTGIKIDRNVISDWEKIREWKRIGAITPKNPDAGTILDWAVKHIHQKLNQTPILIRAAYCGISPQYLLQILSQINHAGRKWKQKEIQTELIQIQKSWYFPPAPWRLTSYEGQSWAIAQGDAYRNANPFPETWEELQEWEADVIPKLIPKPDISSTKFESDNAIINQWIDVQIEE